MNSRKQRFEFAPQEKLKFVGLLWDEFCEKVLQMEACISDESYISDFHDLFSDSSKAIGEEGEYYIFKRKWKRGFEKKWRVDIEKIPKKKCLDYKKLYINRTKEIFGVDISEVYDRPIPEVLYFISKHQLKQSDSIPPQSA